MLLALLVGPPTAQAAPWVDGDVFAGIGNGRYAVFDNSGNLKETIDSGIPATETTGCSFAPNDELYGTIFRNGTVVRFAGNDPHNVVGTIPTGDMGSESVVFSQSGDFYVGHAGGSMDIKRFNSAGALQQAYNVQTGARGSDWIDLATDQKTMFYTSEDQMVRRFDVASGTQLPVFGTINGTRGYALRILPPGDGSGGVLVAGTDKIVQLGPAGAVVREYDAPGQDYWFALNLDPNGTSFWSGDQATKQFFRFNINTGAVELGPINSTAGTNALSGLCVKGEPTSARSPTKPRVFGRGGLVQAPSNRRCVSRRKFRIRIRERGGIKIESALVFLNNKRLKVLRRRVFQRRRHTAAVNLRGLPKGTFTLKIVVLTSEGDTVRGKRKYHTCTKKRRSRRPPKL